MNSFEARDRASARARGREAARETRRRGGRRRSNGVWELLHGSPPILDFYPGPDGKRGDRPQAASALTRNSGPRTLRCRGATVRGAAPRPNRPSRYCPCLFQWLIMGGDAPGRSTGNDLATDVSNPKKYQLHLRWLAIHITGSGARISRRARRPKFDRVRNPEFRRRVNFSTSASSLAIAFVLAAVIGAERQYRQRNAGFAPMCWSRSARPLRLARPALNGRRRDQIAAYVVSGIGFLGAGVIMKEGGHVCGLNTAATLWCSAAVGALCGVDLGVEAGALTIAMLAGNTLLRPLVNAINRAPIDERRPRRPMR